MRKSPILFQTFSFILLLIVVVICYAERMALLSLIQNANLVWLAAGFVSYICNYLLRSYRLRILTGFHERPFSSILRISCLHGFFSYFLPLRSGDISLPLLLKKESGISLSIGSAILIKSRLLDMLSLGFFLAISTSFSYNHIKSYHLLLFAICSFCLIIVPYSMVFLLRLQKITSLNFFKNLPQDFQLKQYTVTEIFLSFLIWFFVGCTLFSVVVSLSIPLSFLDIWFLTAIQLPLQLFPIQGIANAGNHEAGWVAGFVILGIAPETGLGFALASHVALILYVTILGVIGLFIKPYAKTSHYS
ncbi:MAG: lysylphosphatidylglycerol synthase transmembrane domain-containing protein [Desulfocapsaceae bacterium]|nr:lysylphosphatidylglycerol synthase transmembrane domain-containing protein [Desulfocapsaceae bacterium]